MSLAVIGLYGVVSYAVSQRTREFGVRIALGAKRASIVRLVLVEGLRIASIGVGSGLLVALWVTQALEGLLFGTRPQDPATFVAAAGVLSVVAILACQLAAVNRDARECPSPLSATRSYAAMFPTCRTQTPRR